jgi:uncharacterized protein (DUF488 family)
VVIVHTLGHSTRPQGELVALLVGHGIGGVADVRRFPASRRHPHFGAEALSQALARAGIRYDWLPELGGRRPARGDSPHTAWRNPSFRGYADHMETAEFQQGLDRLVALARERPTAILCAEAVPWRCHRQLIADALVAQGIAVRHIVAPGEATAHRLSATARVEDRRIVYDGGQRRLRV